MKIFDISLPITHDMVIWPGDPPVEINRLSAIKDGNDANISKISMCVHTGTHIDAPSHFIDQANTIEQIPLTKLVGKTFVMDLCDQTDVIDEDMLRGHPDGDKLIQSKKVLFKTRNSAFWVEKPGQFDEAYVGINSSGANYLASLNLELVGVDYLSVASYNETELPHKILLSREIVLLEGINLRDVPPGFYYLYCLPLPILGSDGAPARAILIDQD